MFYKSRMGLTLVLMYVILTGLLLFMASDADPKSHFVLMQAPIAAQQALIHELGLDKYFEGMPWADAYIFIWTPTLVFLYVMGAFLGFGFQVIKSILPKAECPVCNNNIPRFSNEKVVSRNFMGFLRSEVVCPECQSHIMKKAYDTYSILLSLFLMCVFFNSEIAGILLYFMIWAVVLYGLFAKRIFRKVADT